MDLRDDIFIQMRVNNAGAKGVDYSVLLKEADVYGFKRKKVIGIINTCYLVKEVNGSKKVYKKQQENKNKVILNKNVNYNNYDFYESLKRDTDNVKTDVIKNIVDSYASRQQGVLYPYLVKVVEDMGYDKKILDELLISNSYITRNIQGILTIFTHKSAFPKIEPTPTKEKEDYIAHVTKNIINKPTKKAEPKAKTKKDKPFQPMPIPKNSKNINLVKRETHYNTNNEIPSWMQQFPTKDDLNFCCYRFIDSNNKIIYVGRAKNLIDRFNSHEHLPEECYEQVVKIEYCQFGSNDDLDLAEPYFIAKWKPQYNQDFVNKKYSFQITEFENKNWIEFDGGVKIISKKH